MADGTSKNVKFWPGLEISAVFLMGLEISFLCSFLDSQCRFFLPTGLRKFDLLPCFFLVWLSGVEFFRVHWYSLLN